MKPRDTYAAFVIWVALTALGETLVLHANIYPLAGNEFARDVDDAFRLLMALAVPVFTFVVTVLAYSLLRFRQKGEPADDGPPIHSHRGAVWGWFAVTSGLTILVMVHPGLRGCWHCGKTGTRTWSWPCKPPNGAGTSRFRAGLSWKR